MTETRTPTLAEKRAADRRKRQTAALKANLKRRKPIVAKPALPAKTE